MRRYFLLPVCVAYIFMMAGVVSSCNSNAKDELAHHHHDHGHGHEHEHEHEDEHHHDDEHEHDEDASSKHVGNEIIVEPEIAADFGVTIEKVQPGTFNKITKVSGKVLESTQGSSVASSPTAGTLTFAAGITEGKQVSAGTLIATVKSANISGGDVNAAAKATLDAAKRELDRLRPLHEHGIVSTAEYNEALAAYESAKAAYSPAASSGRIVTQTAGTITSLMVQNGQFVEVGAPIAVISSSRTLTLRADIPQRLAQNIAHFSNAKVKTAYSDEVIDLQCLDGKRVDGGNMVSSRPGYVPVYFSFTNNGVLVPGTPAEVYLQGEPRQDVITVPVTALSEQQGNYFVYVQIDEEGYLKKHVTIGENDGTRVEILNGLKAGDSVVATGMMAVRLAESSGVVPEGHSHNH